MNIKQYLPVPLMALMALTRFHHFGDAFSLPDASLAVFFLAGLSFARRWWLLGLLFVEAAAIDYVAITHFNVSAFCVSPAYLFLIPTYAAMWFAGSFCAKFKEWNAGEIALAIGALALATSTAFLISNGSFYLLSGRYSDLSWTQFVDRTLQYYPFYTGAALCYGVLGLVIIKLIRALPSLTTHHKTV